MVGVHYFVRMLLQVPSRGTRPLPQPVLAECGGCKVRRRFLFYAIDRDGNGTLELGELETHFAALVS